VDRPRQLAVHVALELDDDLLGAERGAGQVGRAGGLTAAALHAGVEVEPPLPGEFLELRDPEALGLLDVLDLRDLAAGRELGEEDVERRRQHVDEVGTRDDRDEGQRHGGMEEPHAQVGGAQRALPHADRQHRLPQRPADRRPRGPPGLHGGQPARLHHEAAEVDHQQQPEDVGEARGGIDPGRPQHEAPPHGQAEPDHEEQPEQVEHRLVGEVEVALQQLVAEQRQRDVVVDRRQHGAQEQREEAPEHDGVHHARVRLRQRAHLAERVLDHELHALGNLVQARLGAAGAPELDPLPESPDEERDGHEPADVEQDLRPGGNVPEGVAKRHGRRRHEGSNDTMGNIAATAE
jgi:hypothetical protein